MILSRISKALESIGPVVFYGMATTLKDDLWDYIVFSRRTLRTATNKTGYTDLYEVAIVRENYVPDEDVDAVIDAMLGIPGVKLSGSEFAYEYATKPNTNTVVEMLVLQFARARKSDG